jgi:hypothetical protein
MPLASAPTIITCDPVLIQLLSEVAFVAWGSVLLAPLFLSANRSRPAPPGNSGDWKIGIGDRAPKTATTDPILSVSNLRARKGPRNAGLCAGHDDVSKFEECVADDAAPSNRSANARAP